MKQVKGEGGLFLGVARRAARQHWQQGEGIRHLNKVHLIFGDILLAGFIATQGLGNIRLQHSIAHSLPMKAKPARCVRRCE